MSTNAYVDECPKCNEDTCLNNVSTRPPYHNLECWSCGWFSCSTGNDEGYMSVDEKEDLKESMGVGEYMTSTDLIDMLQGNVPYVERCEECQASDGSQLEGCDSCGIIHYQTSKGLRDLYGFTWGFFHKDSPLWEKYQ